MSKNVTSDKKALFRASKILFLSALFGLGCQNIESLPYPCDAFCHEETVEDTDVEDIEDVESDVEDTGEITDSGEITDTEPDVEEVTGTPWAGVPCAEDDDCAGANASCLNAETLAAFGLDLEIRNGFCSRLACSNNEQCGPNGYCFDTKPFSGTSISLCFSACQETAQCRWQEGYGCYPLANLETDPEATPTDDAVCLPQSITVLIECNDAHCDINTDGDLNEEGEDIWDYLDNCPYIENGDQADSDRDGLGDLCDPVDDNASTDEEEE